MQCIHCMRYNRLSILGCHATQSVNMMVGLTLHIQFFMFLFTDLLYLQQRSQNTADPNKIIGYNV